MTEEINIENLGNIKYSKDDIYSFPEGIIGLEHAKEFILVQYNESFAVLQSIDAQEVSFIVTEAIHWDINMQIDISEENCKIIQLEAIEDAWVLLIANIQETNPPELKINFQGPLIINSAKRKGIQQIVHAQTAIQSITVNTADTTAKTANIAETSSETDARVA